jgi:hypothetical protein
VLVAIKFPELEVIPVFVSDILASLLRFTVKPDSVPLLSTESAPPKFVELSVPALAERFPELITFIALPVLATVAGPLVAMTLPALLTAGVPMFSDGACRERVARTVKLPPGP